MRNNISNRQQQHPVRVGSYDYEGLCHWFFYNYGNKSTSGGKLNAYGNELVSYSTTVGQLHQNKQGEIIFLYERGNHGRTTDKQVDIACAASPHRAIQVVDCRASDHVENLQAMIDKAKKAAVKYSRARKHAMQNTWQCNFERLLSDADWYASHFKLGRTKEAKEAKRLMTNGLESVTITETKNDKDYKKWFRSLVDEAIEQFEKCSELSPWIFKKDFKTGKEKRFDTMQVLRNWKVRHNGHDVIQVFSDKVQTSQHISVKTLDARVMLKFWERGILERGDKIGVWTVDRVTPTRLFIGCHELDLKQCQRAMARVRA